MNRKKGSLKYWQNKGRKDMSPVDTVCTTIPPGIHILVHYFDLLFCPMACKVDRKVSTRQYVYCLLLWTLF